MSAIHSAGRPRPAPVDPDGIPAALKAMDCWVAWRYVESADPETGEIDWDKPPRNARTGGLASSTNPKTWSTFAEALSAYRRGGLDGVGFVLRRSKGEDGKEESGGLVGVDLDDCRDPATGLIAEWAMKVIRELDTYTEVSPSGAGVRLFLYGDLPPHGRKKGAYENYQSGRYVTVTGRHVEGTPRTIEHRQEHLLRVHLRVFGEKIEPTKAGPRQGAAPASLDDLEIIRRASEAKNGDRFARLWRGEVVGHNSGSEADLALCNYLAFWCGPDEQRIADLFAQSGLFRSKWNREDYRRRTIAKALASRTEFYDPTQRAAFGNGNGKGHEQPSAAGGGEGSPPEGDRSGAGSAAKGRVNEAEDDPHRLARLILADHTTADGPALRWWRDEFHRWDGRAYRPLPDKEVKAELAERVKREFDARNRQALDNWTGKGEPPTARKVTTRLVSDVVQAIQGMTVLPAAVEAPTWLAGAGPVPAAEVLSCRNGLLHLPSWSAGADCLRRLTPQLFSLNALDYDFLPKAPPPARWLKFLGELWGDDSQAVEALQEWAGYTLLADTRYHKILMIVGPKRSGKGTIARVLRALVGIENTASPTLASLGLNFGLAPLLGKTLAVISDARLSGRTDAAMVVERLLSISGEDAQTIDRKHKAHVTAALPVRFMVLTNELPRLADPAEPLVGRLIVLRQTRSFYGQEDVTLTDRLVKELPGILLWALAGWKRLRERGRFQQPDSGKTLATDMEDLSSPIGAFVRDCCEVGAAHEVYVEDLYERWKAWAHEQGHKEAGTRQVFGRNLRAALPHLGDGQRRLSTGRVMRVYTGLRVKEEASNGIPEW